VVGAEDADEIFVESVQAARTTFGKATVHGGQLPQSEVAAGAEGQRRGSRASPPTVTEPWPIA
jgi:hypothetical protein